MNDRPETTSFRRSRLPHWQVAGGRYFVTLCQKGAIPAEAAARIRRIRSESEELCGGEPLEMRRKIFKEMEDWLDRFHPTRDLARPEVAPMIMEAIDSRRRNGEWAVLAFVVMPNHLHLFMKPLQGDLFASMIDFKRWTGRRCNLALSRSGPFWQREWFDHWSRTPEEDAKIVKYIRHNPVKAGLCREERDWKFRD